VIKRIIEPRPWIASREEQDGIFRASGFEVAFTEPTVALPPPVWALAPAALLRPVDHLLRRYEPMNLSYVHGYRRSA
jgi:hypothetical protein